MRELALMRHGRPGVAEGVFNDSKEEVKMSALRLKEMLDLKDGLFLATSNIKVAKKTAEIVGNILNVLPVGWKVLADFYPKDFEECWKSLMKIPDKTIVLVTHLPNVMFFPEFFNGKLANNGMSAAKIEDVGGVVAGEKLPPATFKILKWEE